MIPCEGELLALNQSATYDPAMHRTAKAALVAD